MKHLLLYNSFMTTSHNICNEKVAFVPSGGYILLELQFSLRSEFFWLLLLPVFLRIFALLLLSFSSSWIELELSFVQLGPEKTFSRIIIHDICQSFQLHYNLRIKRLPFQVCGSMPYIGRFVTLKLNSFVDKQRKE